MPPRSRVFLLYRPFSRPPPPHYPRICVLVRCSAVYWVHSNISPHNNTNRSVSTIEIDKFIVKYILYRTTHIFDSFRFNVYPFSEFQIEIVYISVFLYNILGISLIKMRSYTAFCSISIRFFFFSFLSLAPHARLQSLLCPSVDFWSMLCAYIKLCDKWKYLYIIYQFRPNIKYLPISENGQSLAIFIFNSFFNFADIYLYAIGSPNIHFHCNWESITNAFITFSQSSLAHFQYDISPKYITKYGLNVPFLCFYC